MADKIVFSKSKYDLLCTTVEDVVRAAGVRFSIAHDHGEAESFHEIRQIQGMLAQWAERNLKTIEVVPVKVGFAKRLLSVSEKRQPQNNR